MLVVICALFAVQGGSVLAGEAAMEALPELPQPKPGEDPAIVRRNFVQNSFAERSGGRETTVKFDDNLDTKCPTLTSLFFSTGDRVKWLTPNFSLSEADLFVKGRGADGTSADVVVQNAECRYVLTVKRYELEDGERVVRVDNIPALDKSVFKPRPADSNDKKSGFDQRVIRFAGSSKPIDFTGMSFFSPTTLTVYLANADKDLKISSESNFLSHAYSIEIKNGRAALRLSISKELYSNGQWVSAYAR